MDAVLPRKSVISPMVVLSFHGCTGLVDPGSAGAAAPVCGPGLASTNCVQVITKDMGVHTTCDTSTHWVKCYRGIMSSNNNGNSNSNNNNIGRLELSHS